MNILVYVFIFITFLTVSGYHYVENFMGEKSLHEMYKESLGHLREKRNNNIQADWNRLKKKQHSSNNNSRLSLALIKERKEDFLSVVVNLLRRLYGEQQFFIEMAAKRPGFEEQLLECLSEHYRDKQYAPITRTEHLAKIQFNDESLQYVLYKILKGSYTYPSLAEYITIKNRNVSICSAKPELLEVLLGPNVTYEIIALREQFQQQKKQIKNEDKVKLLTSQFVEDVNKLLQQVCIWGTSTVAKPFFDVTAVEVEEEEEV